MMHQIAVLKAMLNYTWFLKYYPTLIKLKKLPSDHRLLLTSISKYYTEYDVSELSLDELESYFYYQNPSIQNPEGFELIFRQLREIHLDNEELVQDILAHVLEIHYCAQIAEQAVAVADERAVTAIDKIENLIELYRSEIGAINAVENDICKLTLAELIEEEIKGGLDWHLNFLNNTLGPLREGTLGHIFARPNVGKTSMAINIACNAAARFHITQSSDVVLYLGNEEKVNSLKKRIYTAITDMPLKWVIQNPEKAEKKYYELGMDKIMMVDNVVHIAQVEKYIRNVMPRVTIIDQGPKVMLYNRDLIGHEKLQQLYNIYKEKAKKYNTAIITTGQADKNADNTRFLKLKHIDGSKVGIPGEVEWALGIGQLDNEDGIRYFNIAKKKSGLFGKTSITFNELSGKFKNPKKDR